LLHLYVGLYAYTYKVRVYRSLKSRLSLINLHKVKVKLYILCNKVKVLLDKIGSKMQPKVVLLLPFIATFESKVYRYPRMNTQEGRA
jgi:hypothetical protein